MKLIFIGACGYADGYKGLGNEFEKANWKINFFPLYNYYNNTNKSFDDIIDYILGNNINYIKEKYNIHKIDYYGGKPDLVFWFHNYMTFNRNEYKKLSQLGVKNILFNWDAFQYYSNNKCWKSKIIYKKFCVDYIYHNFTVNPLEYEYFTNLGYTNINYVSPGANEEEFYKIIDNNYKCEISFILTNLYTNYDEFPNQKINRKDILDHIYHNTNAILHIYGPPFLKDLYPKAYKGFINYYDAKKVFSNSLINLNISPVGDYFKLDNLSYFSERLPQILACQGLVVSEQDYSDLLIHKEDYLRLDSLEDINKYLKFVREHNDIMEMIRKNGYRKFKEKLKWKYTYDKIMEFF